jgi:hypothetical protein
MCVLIFFTVFFSETFLILRKIQGDIIDVHSPSCKVPFIRVRV